MAASGVHTQSCPSYRCLSSLEASCEIDGAWPRRSTCIQRPPLHPPSRPVIGRRDLNNLRRAGRSHGGEEAYAGQGVVVCLVVGPIVDGWAVKLLLMLPSRRRWWVVLLCWLKWLAVLEGNCQMLEPDQTCALRSRSPPAASARLTRPAQVPSINHSAILGRLHGTARRGRSLVSGWSSGWFLSLVKTADYTDRDERYIPALYLFALSSLLQVPKPHYDTTPLCSRRRLDRNVIRCLAWLDRGSLPVYQISRAPIS